MCLWAISALLAGCASAPAVPVTGVGHAQTIELANYAVSPPPGTDWVVEVKQEAGAVTFERRKVWITGRVLGATTITVMQNEAVGEQPVVDEEAEANRFRDNEETIMRQEGVAKGLYELYDVERGITTLDGMKLYTLRYKQSVRQGAMQPSYVIEATLYVYFPPDFEEHRRFYVFHISDGKEKFSMATVDTRQIEPVIRSFRLRQPTR